MNRSRINRGRLAILLPCLLPLLAQGLPEDREQELAIDGVRSETFFEDAGTIFIYYGTPDHPAVAEQGSMRITGLEIRAELRDGEVNNVTATGSPARFQQQPAADQAVLHASGRVIFFDNGARTIAVDGEALISQEGMLTMEAEHVDYDLESRRLNAESGEAGEGVRTVIPRPGESANDE